MTQLDFDLHACAPQAHDGSSCGLAAQQEAVSVARTGRPKKHRTAADRVKAHRATVARVEMSMTPEMRATIDDIAQYLDSNRVECIQHFIRFALTNRNWKQLGLMGRGK